jgi:hypothetical protein
MGINATAENKKRSRILAVAENSAAWRLPGQATGDLVRVYPNKAIDETPEAVSIGLKSGL